MQPPLIASAGRGIGAASRNVTTLRAIRYRAVLRRWAFRPYQASEKPVGEAIVDSVLSKQIDDLGVHPAPLRFDTVREPVSGVIPAWISSSLRNDPVYGVLSWRAMRNARHVSGRGGILHAITMPSILGESTWRAIQTRSRMEASPAWLQTFLDRLAADDLSAATRRGYRYDLRQFIAWYTGLNSAPPELVRLTEHDLITWRQHMRGHSVHCQINNAMRERLPNMPVSQPGSANLGRVRIAGRISWTGKQAICQATSKTGPPATSKTGPPTV